MDEVTPPISPMLWNPQKISKSTLKKRPIISKFEVFSIWEFQNETDIPLTPLDSSF